MTNKTINNLKAAFTFIKVDKKPLKHLLYVVLCSLISFNTSGLPSKFRLVGIGDLSTEMTLVFDTSFDGDFENKNPKVYYATKYNEVSELTSAFLEPASTNTSFGMVNNICRFTNLEPNTIYYFKVVDDDGSSAIYHFETLPNDDTPLSIIAGGNSRNGRSTRRNANIVAGRLKPHAIILSGPFTDNSNSEEWQDWFEDWQHSFGTSNRIAPIIPARSNHENNNIDLMELLGTPDKMYYTSTNNSLLSVITLQGGMTFSYLEEQTAWLLNTLAHTNTTYKIVQYHGTMRSHFGGGIDRNGEYYHWAKMFEDYQIDLVVETHRPLSKTTWPISVCVGGLLCEEGFKRDDENGVVYTGDGAWGAPRRPSDDNKSWTHSSDMLNNFKWIFIFPEKMELRTVSFENSLGVSELDINNRFQIPGAIDIYGDVTIINAPNNLPAITNKPQDNETYVNIQPITLSAAIENSDFSIDKIDFYINDSLVFTGIHGI